MEIGQKASDEFWEAASGRQQTTLHYPMPRPSGSSLAKIKGFSADPHLPLSKSLFKQELRHTPVTPILGAAHQKLGCLPFMTRLPFTTSASMKSSILTMLNWRCLGRCADTMAIEAHVHNPLMKSFVDLAPFFEGHPDDRGIWDRLRCCVRCWRICNAAHPCEICAAHEAKILLQPPQRVKVSFRDRGSTFVKRFQKPHD